MHVYRERKERGGPIVSLSYIPIIGYMATAFTVVSFVPQVVRTARTKKTTDLSLAYFAVFSLANVFWIAYGSLIASFPLIVGNAILFCLAMALVVMKLRYK